MKVYKTDNNVTKNTKSIYKRSNGSLKPSFWVVLALIIFWTAGTVLSLVLTVKDCNTPTARADEVTISSNVASADTIVQDTYDFVFNTVSLPLNVTGSYSFGSTQNDMLNISLSTHYFTFSLHFTYNGIDHTTSSVNWYTDGLWLNDGGNITGLTPITTFGERFSNTSTVFNVGKGSFTQYVGQNPSSSFINYYLLSNRVGSSTSFDFNTTMSLSRFYNYVFPNTSTSNGITYSYFPISVELGVERFSSTNFNRVIISNERLSTTTSKFSYTYLNDLDEYFIISSTSSINTSWYSDTSDYYFSYTRFITNNFTDNSIYQTGYQEGYRDGESSGYDKGLEIGSKNGYQNGYNAGKTAGIQQANDYTFIGLLGAVVDAPIQAVTGLLNFDLLGFNLADFCFALLTLALILTVVRLFLKGG